MSDVRTASASPVLAARVVVVVPGWASWFAACGAIAATYVYFLIFAEFALLDLVAQLSPEPAKLRGVMFALGAGGIAGALLAARLFRLERARTLLAQALRVCALAAIGVLLAHNHGTILVAVAVVGLSLGALTVLLTATLRGAVGDRRLGLCIGTGTGLAYAICNAPFLFQSLASRQTIFAIVTVAVASFLPRAMRLPVAGDAPVGPEYSRGGVARWVILLLALVWMDSAAFYIFQHTPSLRAATWGESVMLTANAVTHLVAAVGAGWLLDRGGRGRITATAALLLGVACLMLNGTLPSFVPAAWIYTAGVSFYSTVLVEYPARAARAGVAAIVFGVAGWVGSALGIGMAQGLAQVPVAFLALAGATIAVVLAGRARALHRVGVAAAFIVAASTMVRGNEPDSLVARGREVYIAEGCMHCHSQYVRPRDARDVLCWGPATSLREALAGAPPLLGNRRQGPDLANVGNRRSPEWNQLHLLAPRDVSPGSRMPAYSHLFAAGDERGAALVAYLSSLGAESIAERRTQIAAWQPDTRDVMSVAESRHLFARLCAPCHGESGRGDGALAAKLSVRPPDWSQAEWRYVPPGAELEPALGRIIRFGLPGLPMAGHEYLADREVIGLARFVQALHNAPEGASLPAVQP